MVCSLTNHSSAALAFPGWTARICSDDGAFLKEVALLFDVAERTDADLEYRVTHSNGRVIIEQGCDELYSGTSTEWALINLYGHVYERFVSSTRHFLVHAGAAAHDHGAVLLPGAQESGKSTLTVLLATRGCQIITDDVVAIDPETVKVHPYPRHLLIRPDTFRLNPAARTAVEPVRTLEAYGELVHVVRSLTPPPTEPVPITAIVFPHWASDTGLVPLSRGETASRLMDNSLNLRLLGEAGVRYAARIARRIRGYALSVRDPLAATRLILDCACVPSNA
jgi:hypothetical protein